LPYQDVKDYRSGTPQARHNPVESFNEEAGFLFYLSKKQKALSIQTQRFFKS